MPDSKSQLRQELRQRWKNISQEKESFEKSIERFSKQFLRSQPPATTWAVYRAHQDEVNLDSLWQSSDLVINWVFPQLVDESLVFLKAKGPTDFVQGRFGIWEPKDRTAAVKTSEITGVFVPGLGFDWKGGRLGRGKGFYDRTLAGYRGLKIGISPVSCMEESVPLEEFDVLMDYVITDQGIWSCASGKYL